MVYKELNDDFDCKIFTSTDNEITFPTRESLYTNKYSDNYGIMFIVENKNDIQGDDILNTNFTNDEIINNLQNIEFKTIKNCSKYIITIRTIYDNTHYQHEIFQIINKFNKNKNDYKQIIKHFQKYNYVIELRTTFKDEKRNINILHTFCASKTMANYIYNKCLTSDKIIECRKENLNDLNKYYIYWLNKPINLRKCIICERNKIDLIYNFDICGVCRYKKNVFITATQIYKSYFLEKDDIKDIKYINAGRGIRKYKLYLKSDIEKVRDVKYTPEKLNKLNIKKQKLVERQIERERNKSNYIDNAKKDLIKELEMLNIKFTDDEYSSLRIFNLYFSQYNKKKNTLTKEYLIEIMQKIYFIHSNEEIKEKLGNYKKFLEELDKGYCHRYDINNNNEYYYDEYRVKGGEKIITEYLKNKYSDGKIIDDIPKCYFDAIYKNNDDSDFSKYCIPKYKDNKIDNDKIETIDAKFDDDIVNYVPKYKVK